MSMVTDGGSSLPSPAKPGPSKELSARVASGIVMIAVALLAAYQGGWLFALFWLAAGIAMMVEWTNMTGVEPRRPVQILYAVGLSALTLTLLTGAGFGIGLTCVLAALALGALVTQGSSHRLWGASGFVYAAVIVVVPPLVRAHPELGLVGLLWMFAVVWATDIAAYFTGRALGGPKLFPAVSPKKTWSGFFGGLVAAAVAGFLVAWGAQRAGLAHPVGLTAAILLSLVASVASQIGDLAESALKRHCDVKDSSHLIPGHGGVMDRLDGFWAVSLLMAFVLVFIRFSE
jgi:phosphatidate cytidylyltransferase